MRSRVVWVVPILLVLFGSVGTGQFKSQVQQDTNIASELLRGNQGNVFFGWFNPERFHMRHSFDLSYNSFAGESFSLGTYTNSMMYEFAENLNARADVSLSFSPFSSFSTFNKNDLSSVYLSRAEVNYQPWDNVTMRFQYRQPPPGRFNYYSPYYYSPWMREDGF